MNEPSDTAGNRTQVGYEAKGIPLGSFRAYPTISATGSYDSNVFARKQDIESDVSLTLAPNVRVVRDAPGERLSLSASTQIRRYAQLRRQNDEQYRARAEGFYELTRATRLSASAEWSDATVSRGTFENGFQIGGPLRKETLSADLDASHRFNRLAIDLGLSGQRFHFSDVRLDDDTVIDQDFRDGRRLGASLALAYDVGAHLALRANGRIDDFDYRDPRPASNRDATGFSLMAGGRYEVTRLFLAEFSAGFRRHKFKNAAFGDISGLALSGRLRWYPTPLVTVRLDLTQSTSTSAFDSVSAVNVTSASLSSAYEFKRNVLLSATVEASHEDYGGLGETSDHLAVSTEAGWKVNRRLQFTARARYEQRRRSASSAIPTFDAVRVSLGARLAF